MNIKGRILLTALAVAITAIMLLSHPVLADTQSLRGAQSPSNNYGCDCIGAVGNVDCDYLDGVDFADLVALIDHLFISRDRLPNREEANIDGDLRGVVDVADLTALIDHLFISLAELPECPKPFNAPPETFITVPSDRFPPDVYINAVVPGSPVTGVLAQWQARDIVDFPFFDPTFEFRWRVYGPYFTDTSGVNRWVRIREQFVKPVFVLKTGEILLIGEGNTFIVCDTIPIISGPDTVSLQITCDTALVDTVKESNIYGRIDTLFDVNDPAFLNSADNRVAASNLDSATGWVSDTTAIFYDLFRSFLDDKTRSATFVFWVQARDPVDSLVMDPTPEFVDFKVIDPKFERNIIVADLQLGAQVNGSIRDSARAYWQRAIGNWQPDAGYADSRDYHIVVQSTGNILSLETLLSYKVAILVTDDTKPGVLRPVIDKVFRAQDAGLAAWLTARTPLVGGEGASPELGNISIPPGYPEHFGITTIVYSGWDWHARANFPFQRIEDFIGATSTQPQLWPHIAIDSALLFNRYKWSQHLFPNRGVFPFLSNLGPDSNQFALPEVDFLVPTPEAEIMYTYNSMYGLNHFLGPNFSFHSKPVAVRLETTHFRSAQWLFTPYAFDDAAIQPVIDIMLDWLIDSTFNPAPEGPGNETTYSKTGKEL